MQVLFLCPEVFAALKVKENAYIYNIKPQHYA